MTSFKGFSIAVAFLVVFFAGCNFRPGHKAYTYAEQLLANGEIIRSIEPEQKKYLKIQDLFETCY